MKRLFTLLALSVWFCVPALHAQFSNSITYDFTDGTLITNGGSDDGALTLSGNYSHHGTQYGLNMKVDGTISIKVTQSSTIRFTGSKYSKLNMQATTAGGVDLGTHNTQVTNDLAETFDFVYTGGEETINFVTTAGAGNDLYLPTIEVVPAQLGGDAALTAAIKNIIYTFDLRDGSIIPAETTLNGNYTIEQGLFKIESGPSNAYGYNGDQHGSVLKTGNKITLKVAGNSTIKIGGCQYSNGTINVSSETGAFDQSSQASQTAECYHNDGTTIDFLYAGTEGEVVLSFEGTTYVPIIEIAPVPFSVELTPWVQKAGTITVNGVEIGLTSGAAVGEAANVTVSAGEVISATDEKASIRIDLGGQELSTYTPTVTGDIASAAVDGSSIVVTYADDQSKPYSYTIDVADNSQTVEAVAGETYTYNFADGSVIPQTGYATLRYPTFISEDGILTIKSNTDDETAQFGYHDSSHGAVMYSGNSFEMIVAGNATITFGICQYGASSDAVFVLTNSAGETLGEISATNKGVENACGTSSFSYTGDKGTVTATLKSEAAPTGEFYLHNLTIENAAEIAESNGKIDVWDFGAEQLSASDYNNNLTEEIINSWYDASITPGSSGNVLPSFSAGVLSWVGGSNDRLRTSNTNLTRYDENASGGDTYTGRVYVNAGAATGRYMSLTLSEDDEVTLVMLTQNGSGKINFEYVADPAAQTDVVEVGSDPVEVKFVAKADGTYHIFDTQDKPSYFRILRKDADYVTLSGSIDLSAASDIPSGFGIVFENEAGKKWTADVHTSDYHVDLPAGYQYKLSLTDANGYVISSDNTLDITTETTEANISIEKVELYTVSGSITGLGDAIANLSLAFTPAASANKIFVPEPVIDVNAATYTVQLEPSCEYTISAEGVNDYTIPNNTITIGTADETADVVFEAKTLYAITVTADALTTEQLANLQLTFTNMDEDGYTYTFTSIDGISLRDGVYTIAYDGLDAYPVQLALTSNLKVEGADTSKELNFEAISVWSFADKAIASGATAYNGLVLSGSVSNEVAKGHLVGQPEATVQVPVKVGQKVIVSYYYAADFTIDGGEAITTASGSTSQIESTEYVYTGTEAGYVTLAFTAKSYVTEIQVVDVVEYAAEITVGTDKMYQTINAALAAIEKMDRPNDERVTVLIDPGNYEEMLVIKLKNITLKNAASTPSIALADAGVDIDENAVRVTSYYGYGYSYYSQGDDNKWNADVLRVNKENGYHSYENQSGSTNASYWDATVVVMAEGFQADFIIFENSFNQYISQKESDDIVVMWESGNKGERPTDVGNTAVQDRSYVERAAAIAFTSSGDKAVLYNCRVVGRQDSFYGSKGSRVAIYKGAMMGAVDYIFGGMTAVFYQSDLVMNVSDADNDRSYLTAAQQDGGRGFLMYECTVKSAEPGVDNNSDYRANPGYFGRPWAANTSEVVFYNTTVETTNNPAFDGQSLIMPEGWKSSLGGESPYMYEFGTTEASGEDNQTARASWSTLLTEATLTDGTEISTFNFTKGSDDWDPIPALVEREEEENKPTAISNSFRSDIKIWSKENLVRIDNLEAEAEVTVYSLNGSAVDTFQTVGETTFNVQPGFWIIKVRTATEQQTAKIFAQ